MSRARRPFVAYPRHPVTGRQFQISAKTERELAFYVDKIQSLRSELRLGLVSADEVDRKLRRLVHGPATLERAAKAFAERPDVARNTRRRVASFVSPKGAGASLAASELDALDGPTLERWDGRLRARLAQSTIVAAWRTLRQIVRYAAVRGWIARVPWGTWRPSSRAGRQGRAAREAARTVEELARILDAARELDVERETAGRFGDLEPKTAAVVLLGLRQGELAGLRWLDVDPRAQTVTIGRQWGGDEPPKGKRTHTLRADPVLFDILGAWAERLRARGLFRPTGPVFPLRSSNGTPFPYEGGKCLHDRDLRSVVRRAGLPNLAAWSAHSLRDTFVTLEAAANHGDLSTVAERSRHASIASLVRYLRSRSRQAAAPGFTIPGRGTFPRLPAVSETLK